MARRHSACTGKSMLRSSRAILALERRVYRKEMFVFIVFKGGK
jgi:hypothetical protein